MSRKHDPWVIVVAVTFILCLIVGVTYAIREGIACERRGGTMIQGRYLAIGTK